MLKKPMATQELLEKHPQVIVRNNAAGKEKVLEQPVRKEKEGKANYESVKTGNDYKESEAVSQ